MILSTTSDIAGHRVVKTLGVVQGNATKTQKGGGFFTTHLAGGHDIQTMEGAAQGMLCSNAINLGGNAVIGTRYETYTLDNGFLTFMVYGTAVIVEAV